MKKVLLVSLNRSEYSRLRSVVRALLQEKEIDLRVVGLSSKYANNEILFQQDKFPFHYSVKIDIDERSPFKTACAISQIVKECARIFHNEKPDVVLVLGDRYEAFGAVTAAAYQGLFIAHIQGGEVSGTLDEHTRHAITKLAHVHFPSTPKAAERIVRLGERPDMIHMVGCPGTDALLETSVKDFETMRYEMYVATQKRRDILEKLSPGYLLVQQFPVATELADAVRQIECTLSALRKSDRSKVIILPPPDAGGDLVEKMFRDYEREDERAIVLKHVPHELYVNLMRNAVVMIGNSSAGIRETGYLGTPTINIGSRQAGRERSRNIVDVSADAVEIEKAVQAQIVHGVYAREDVYGDGHAGEKIARILAHVDSSKIQKMITY